MPCLFSHSKKHQGKRWILYVSESISVRCRLWYPLSRLLQISGTTYWRMLRDYRQVQWVLQAWSPLRDFQSENFIQQLISLLLPCCILSYCYQNIWNNLTNYFRKIKFHIKQDKRLSGIPILFKNLAERMAKNINILFSTAWL